MISDCIRRAQTIHIITFSGAHGTGKSTVIEDLKREVEESGGKTVSTVPSCSREWCRRNGIVAYDDINRLGRRTEMQTALPGLLEDLLAEKVNESKEIHKIILCDRWFGDIIAYSATEMSEEDLKKTQKIADEKYCSVLYGLSETAYQRGISMYLTHIFIPLSACLHNLPRGETEGKVRATGDQHEWEAKYNEISNRYCQPTSTLVLSSPDRQGRVDQITKRIANLNDYRGYA